MDTRNSTKNTRSVPKVTYVSPMYRHKTHRVKKNGVHNSQAETQKNNIHKQRSNKYVLGFVPVLDQNSVYLQHQSNTQEKHYNQKSKTCTLKPNVSNKSKDKSIPEITSLGKFHNETKSGIRKLLTFALTNIPKLPLPPTSMASLDAAAAAASNTNEKGFLTEYIYTLVSLCVGAVDGDAEFVPQSEYLVQSYTYTENLHGYIVYFVLNPNMPKSALKECLVRMFNMFGKRCDTGATLEKHDIALRCNEGHHAFFKEELGVDVTNLTNSQKYEHERDEVYKVIAKFMKDATKNFNKADLSSTDSKNSKINNSVQLFDIDYNLLKDVPQSELPLVVENIHAFRNDVLIKEQDKLQKEKLTELAKQREKLKNVYKRMMNAGRGVESGMKEGGTKGENEEEEGEEEEDDDDDEELDNDEQLEEQRVKENARAAEAQYKSLLDKSLNSPNGLLYKYKRLVAFSDDELDRYKDNSKDSVLLEKLNQYCADHGKNNIIVFNKNEIIEQRRLDDLNRAKFGTPVELDISTDATSTPDITKSTAPTPSGIKISLSSSSTTSSTPTSQLEKTLSSLLSKHLADSSTEEDNQEVIGIIMDIIKDNSYKYDLYHEELEIILSDLFEGEDSGDGTSANVVQDILATLKEKVG